MLPRNAPLKSKILEKGYRDSLVDEAFSHYIEGHDTSREASKEEIQLVRFTT